MRILITGPNGFVGKHLMQAIPEAIPVPNLRGSKEEVAERVKDADVIIHTAAMSHIDVCEKDPEGSYRANVELPVWIAEAAPNAKLIFFSSDQVYSACKVKGPFTEDTTEPGNTYAKHKLEMEKRVLKINPKAILLRATWMFDMDWGYISCLNGTVYVSNQHRGVTYIKEVAENVRKMITADIPGGAYNFGSECTLTTKELAEESLKLMGLEKETVFISKENNLWMNCSRLRAYGIDFSDSLNGVRKCLRELGGYNV